MNPFPILLRELRCAARQHQVLRQRVLLARWAAGIAFVLMVVESLGFPVFRVCAPWAFAGIALQAVHRSLELASGIIATERQQQTLELVFLTGVGPTEFFLGKLAGVFVVVGSEVLACLPLLALPFLSGGLSFETFSAYMVWLPAAVLTALSVALLASTLCRDEGAASVGAWVTLLAWCVVTPLPWFLGLRLSGLPPFHESWLDLSPARTGWLLFDGLTSLTAPHFWRGLSLMLAVSGFNLLASSIVLARIWRRIGSPGSFLPATGSKADERWRRTRRECLDRDPTEWVGRRDPRGARVAAWIMGGIVASWLACGIAWPKGGFSTLVILTVLLLLCCLLGPLEAYSIARITARDRRSGAFELLLTTPLNPASILDGYKRGPIVRFRPLRRAVVGFAVMGLGIGLLTRPWNTAAVITYELLIGMGVVWALGLRRDHAGANSFRSAFVTGGAGAALFGNRGTNSWGVFWTGFQLLRVANLLRGGAGLAQFPTGSTWEIILTSVAACIVALFAVAHLPSMSANRRDFTLDEIPRFSGSWGVGLMVGESSRDVMLDEMRRLASEPISETADPRLKNWQPKEPFPAG